MCSGGPWRRIGWRGRSHIFQLLEYSVWLWLRGTPFVCSRGIKARALLAGGPARHRVARSLPGARGRSRVLERLGSLFPVRRTGPVYFYGEV